MAKFEITWDAPEFEYRSKDVSWYWASIIIAALMIAFSVLIKDFLFGLFIVIAEILFIVWGNRVPRILTFRLTDTELEIGGGTKSYSLKAFENWSVDSGGGEWADLFFYSRSHLKLPLLIIIPEEKIEEFRASAKTVLKETEHEASLIDSIERFLRF